MATDRRFTTVCNKAAAISAGNSPCSSSSQVGKYLGELDHTIKAVYQLAPESQVGVQPHGDQVDENYHPGLNLVVWVERKNPALIALGGTLENALTDDRRQVSCQHALPACFTFNLQTVDDRDILEGRGIGSGGERRLYQKRASLVSR